LSLSAEQLLTEASVTGDFDAAVATDTSGYVHIVVKSGSAFGGPLKYYTNRTGTLVETPTGVTGNVDYPRVLVDKRNVVHILYRNTSDVRLYTVNNAAGTFGTPVPLTPSGQRPAGYHNFAADDQNRLFVVYQSSASTSGRGWYLVHGKDGIFTDTLSVFDLPPEYVTRNTSAIAARGNGQIAVTYSPGAVRASVVVCDIFMKRGIISTTDVTEARGSLESFVLHQNYPNPFNPSTHIPFSVRGWGFEENGSGFPPRRAGKVQGSEFTSLKVYDILGREVRTLVNEHLQPGSYKVSFNAEGLSSGVYVYRIQAGKFSASRRMIVAK
jgi:hypothetical protein